jgi:hypothetical protein
VARGLSAGGRILGYRTVRASPDAPVTRRDRSARFEIDPAEAEVIRRIFRAYANGQSMKAIAHALNQEQVAFPAQETKRGPARRGWAVSAVRTILLNEKYAGRWIWNKTRFLKDPDSGRRRPIDRPPEEWIVQERPDLRIINPDLWAAAQARLRYVREAFGFRAGRPQRGRASLAYSPYLLSGILRCGACEARMTGQTATRWKDGRPYRYGWCRCGFAAAKGPSVCAHSVGYRQDRLEATVLERSRTAMTPAMLERLTRMINAHLEAAAQQRTTRADQLTVEIRQLEREAGHLVRFLASGNESDTVRDELRAREMTLTALRAEHRDVAARDVTARPQVHPTWILARFERLDELLRRDPVRAKAELVKHLDGELRLTPLPSAGRERRAEIRGRANLNGLLKGQEAVFQYVGCGGPLCTVRKQPAALPLRGSPGSAVVVARPLLFGDLQEPGTGLIEQPLDRHIQVAAQTHDVHRYGVKGVRGVHDVRVVDLEIVQWRGTTELEVARREAVKAGR